MHGIDLHPRHPQLFIDNNVGPLGKPVGVAEDAILLLHPAVRPEVAEQRRPDDLQGLSAHARLQGTESTLIPTGTVFCDARVSRFSSSDSIWAEQ